MCLSFVCTRRLTAWTLDYIFMVILKGVANGKPAIKPTEIRTLYTSSSQVCTAGGRRTLNYFPIILHTPHRLKILVSFLFWTCRNSNSLFKNSSSYLHSLWALTPNSWMAYRVAKLWCIPYVKRPSVRHDNMSFLFVYDHNLFPCFFLSFFLSFLSQSEESFPPNVLIHLSTPQALSYICHATFIDDKEVYNISLYQFHSRLTVYHFFDELTSLSMPSCCRFSASVLSSGTNMQSICSWHQRVLVSAFCWRARVLAGW